MSRIEERHFFRIKGKIKYIIIFIFIFLKIFSNLNKKKNFEIRFLKKLEEKLFLTENNENYDNLKDLGNYLKDKEFY